MEVLYTARFLRSFKKLPEAVRDDCYRAIESLKKDGGKEVRVHKLHGKLNKYHAFSANFSYRIIVRKDKRKIYCIDVGQHTLYE